MTVDRRDFILRSAALAAGSLPLLAPAQPPAKPTLPLDRSRFVVNLTPLAGAARTITDYSGFAYCPAVDALLMFGGGHAATPEDVVLRLPINAPVWAPDYPATPMPLMTERSSQGALKYLTAGKFWQVPGQRPSLRPVARHTYTGFLWSSAIKRMLLMGVNNGPSYGLSGETEGGNIAEYDPVAMTWEDTGCVAAKATAAFCEDPVSGNIVSIDAYGLRAYDPRTRQWLAPPKLRAPGMAYGENVVHFPPNDRFYYFGHTIDAAVGYARVWEFELDRKGFTPNYLPSSIARPAPMTTNWRPSSAGEKATRFVYDEANKLIVGGMLPNVMLGFRPLNDGTGQWLLHEAQGTGQTTFYCHAYVPRVNTHYVICDVQKERRTFAFRWDRTAASVAADPRPPAPAITVNGTRMPTLQRACDVGGAIAIAAGELHDADATANIVKPVTIRGGATKLVSAGMAGKGILLVNVDTTIQDLDISGAQVGDGNGAGIRHQGGDLKVVRTKLHHCQNALLGPASRLPFTLVMEDCDVYANGSGTGQTHGLYVGLIDRFECRKSRFWDTRIGHHIKSRALTTIVEDCEVGRDFEGNESYNIDIPVGGDAVVARCTMKQGPKTDNSSMISYGSERNPHPGGSLKITRCRLESTAGGIGIRNALPGVVAVIEDCDFIGLATPIQGNHVRRNCRLDGKPMPDIWPPS